jgi:hypothetical protein
MPRNDYVSDDAIDDGVLNNNKVKKKMILKTNNDMHINSTRLQTLKQFYKNKKYLTLFIEIISGTHEQKKLSLRILDWFVTNYAKKYDIMYSLPDKSSLFDVYNDYRNQLKAFRKEGFDPFCRDDRILYQYTQDGVTRHIQTTISQLNFFKWAISNKVVDYVIENFDDIFQDMNDINKRQRRESERYKQNLSDKKYSSEKKYTKRSTDSEYSLETDITKPVKNVNILEILNSDKKEKRISRKTNRKPRQELSESSAKNVSKCKAKVKITFI